MDDVKWCLMLALALVSSAAPAVEPKVIQGAVLEEMLTDKVRTSGSLLSGFFLGDPAEKFGTDKLHVGIQGGRLGDVLCLRVASRDGRYRALVKFDVNASSFPVSQLRFVSKHGEMLAGAWTADLALRMVQSSECDEMAEGALISPLVFDTGRRSGALRDLVVQINPGEARANAQVLAADGASVSGEPKACSRRAGGNSVVFSHICQLSLAPQFAGGLATLKINVVEMTDGRYSRTFPIVLPAP
jgi:hypothetical protein